LQRSILSPTELLVHVPALLSSVDYYLMWPRQQTTIPTKWITPRKSYYVILDVSLSSEPHKTAFAWAFMKALLSTIYLIALGCTLQPRSIGRQSRYLPRHRDPSCFGDTIGLSEHVGNFGGVSSYYSTYTALLCISRHLFPSDMHRLYKAFSRLLLGQIFCLFVFLVR